MRLARPRQARPDGGTAPFADSGQGRECDGRWGRMAAVRAGSFVQRAARAVGAAALLGSLLFWGGCAGTTGQRRSLNVVTAEEIRATLAPSLYYALVELRPRWLWPRGRSSIVLPDANVPVVYLYGMRQQGRLEALLDIHVNDVERVEFINPLDAATRYGTNHAGGVIDVELRGR